MSPTDRQAQDMAHRERARAAANALREYADHLDRAYTAEQYGAAVHASNHRSDANRSLLDAEHSVRTAINIGAFTINPQTGATV